MMRKASLLLFLLTALPLTGCGFSPMYGSYAPSATAEVRSAFQQIEIENIPDRDGQILRNELIDRFNYQNGGPTNAKYKLVFHDLTANIHELDLTKDSESTRSQMTVRGSFDLLDIATGKSLLNRPVSSISSYNILASEFATRVTEINARENAIRDVARQVELQLSLYFNR